MLETSTRHNPIHHLLELRKPEWTTVADAPIAVRYDTDDVEQTVMQTLGLCDLSALTKLGIKGRAAESWLTEQNVDIPAAIYDSCSLADGGLVVRFGTDEFLLESGFANETVPALETALKVNHEGLFRVERQDATFLLVGVRAIDVLSQTCGLNFGEAVSGRLIMSRLAGVSCSILPGSVGDLPSYRLWFDSSYAAYLWKTLEEICRDLDGSIIGAGTVYPELQ